MNVSTSTKTEPAAHRAGKSGRSSLVELSGSSQSDRDHALQRVLPGDRSKDTEIAAFGSSI